MDQVPALGRSPGARLSRAPARRGRAEPAPAAVFSLPTVVDAGGRALADPAPRRGSTRPPWRAAPRGPRAQLPVRARRSSPRSRSRRRRLRPVAPRRAGLRPLAPYLDARAGSAPPGAARACALARRQPERPRDGFHRGGARLRARPRPRGDGPRSLDRMAARGARRRWGDGSARARGRPRAIGSARGPTLRAAPGRGSAGARRRVPTMPTSPRSERCSASRRS